MIVTNIRFSWRPFKGTVNLQEESGEKATEDKFLGKSLSIHFNCTFISTSDNLISFNLCQYVMLKRLPQRKPNYYVLTLHPKQL